MKIGAGIAGIVLGIVSLLYVGLFGGMVGSAAGWLGSLGPGNSTVTNWANVVSIISWLAPLLAIGGGIVTFSNPRAGGVLLAASACLLWYLLGLGMIGKIFVLPIGAAALLAFLSDRSTSGVTPSVASASTGPRPGESESASRPTVASFDRAKWNALLQYDKDIALMADRVRPLGQRWLDELASSYLALNDKTYLPEIERKIVAAANAEAEESERQKARAEDRRKALAQEQERLAEKSSQQRERLAHERARQLKLWRDRIWGNPQRKLLTATSGVVIVLFVVLALWPKKYEDPFAYCKAVGNRDNYTEGGFFDDKYIGPQSSDDYNGEWRCMDGEMFDCNPGASGRACMKPDRSSTPNESIRSYCSQPHEYSFVPMVAVGNSAYSWECNGTVPVIAAGNVQLKFDKRGYYTDSWHKIAPPETTAIDSRFRTSNNGTVLDAQTDLMWAARDNGSDINWADARSYIDNYRGGGFADWRMPTKDDLATLYDSSRSRRAACLDQDSAIRIHVATKLIDITCVHPWASETRGSDAAYFRFNEGQRDWGNPVDGSFSRALPVRSGKGPTRRQ